MGASVGTPVAVVAPVLSSGIVDNTGDVGAAASVLGGFAAAVRTAPRARTLVVVVVFAAAAVRIGELG